MNAFASFQLPESLQKLSPLIPALQSNWLMMHVTVMLLSYATLICGCILSITFLFITNETPLTRRFPSYWQGYAPGKGLWGGATSADEKLTLGRKSPHKINLLQKLDQLSFRAIGIGFPLLTIGILSGSVWANEAWGSYWSWDPKETWSFITWMIFAIYLHLRLTRNWNGLKSAILATIGFFVIWICFLGVNFLAKGLHSYGWFQ